MHLKSSVESTLKVPLRLKRHLFSVKPRRVSQLYSCLAYHHHFQNKTTNEIPKHLPQEDSKIRLFTRTRFYPVGSTAYPIVNIAQQLSAIIPQTAASSLSHVSLDTSQYRPTAAVAFVKGPTHDLTHCMHMARDGVVSVPRGNAPFGAELEST